MSEHYIKSCKYCEFVISQCRCPGPKKEILAVCDSCKAKGFKEVSEMEFVSKIPKEAGDLVGICVFEGQLIVGCQYALFQLIDGELSQVKFKQ